MEESSSFTKEDGNKQADRQQTARMRRHECSRLEKINNELYDRLIPPSSRSPTGRSRRMASCSNTSRSHRTLLCLDMSVSKELRLGALQRMQEQSSTCAALHSELEEVGLDEEAEQSVFTDRTAALKNGFKEIVKQKISVLQKLHKQSDRVDEFRGENVGNCRSRMKVLDKSRSTSGTYAASLRSKLASAKELLHNDSCTLKNLGQTLKVNKEARKSEAKKAAYRNYKMNYSKEQGNNGVKAHRKGLAMNYPCYQVHC
eukprot:TRINITY_DN1863_c0_g1_i3.p1 TRINITY_DN1863_c0_g1~~TRINITY_DN1863_c0_g1_i3.p1  ORF type:complete len:258 (+),score=50.04 TRINITY_DN1863_c0_g1_i3:297-1070(+)